MSKNNENMENIMPEYISDLSKKMLFVGHVPKDFKLNWTTKSYDNSSIYTRIIRSFYGTFYHENDQTTIENINTIVKEINEVITSEFRDEWKKYIVGKIQIFVQGILNLKKTYSNEINVTVELELFVEKLDLICKKYKNGEFVE